MRIPNYLSTIKSSGFYRFVWDKSFIQLPEDTTLRLIVGYSEKGPFNTIVYIDNPADFITTFGNISKRLERKGIFFHRLALQSLAAGPILCINLKPFDYEDKDGERTYKEESEFLSINFDAINTADDPGSVGAIQTIGTRQLFNTNRFWYIDPDTFIKNIRSSKGNSAVKYFTVTTTDSKETSSSVVMRKCKPVYYDLTFRQFFASSNEELPEYLEPIMDDNMQDYFVEAYVFKGKFTDELKSGALKPYFKDGAINPDYINAYGEKVDALAVMANDPSSNFIGRYEGIMLPYFQDAKGSYISIDYVINMDNYRHKLLAKLDVDALYSKLDEATQAEDMDLYKKFFVPAAAPGYTEKSNNAYTDFFKKVKVVDASVIEDFGKGSDEEKTDKVNAFYKENPFKYICTVDKSSGVAYKFYEYVTPLIKLVDPKEAKKASPKDYHAYVEVAVGKLPAELKAMAGLLNRTDAEKFDKYTHVADFKKRTKSEDAIFTGDIDKGTAVFYEWDVNMVNEEAEKLYPIYLKGYTYKSIEKQDTGIELQEKVLGVLVKEKGIREALTNRVDSDYHYLIDTFQSYTNGPGSIKSKLVGIAKAKDNAFAIVNFPPMSAFVDDHKYIKDDAFDINLIADKNNGVKLVSEVEGASWCAYYTQLKFADGAMKYIVPSAALVGNRFVDKYHGRQPYYIVAGPNYGTINYGGLIGPDYNYSRTDLDVLEPLGVNAIIYVPRKGTYINSNQTAKQIPQSALSKVHIRELVIFIQDEIEFMLQNYQWELNTQTLRDTIKEKADYILGNVASNGGIYKFSTVCDESNNTPEVIDNEMLLLDIEIEPARGCGKMVQTLTLRKTGGMTSK